MIPMSTPKAKPDTSSNVYGTKVLDLRVHAPIAIHGHKSRLVAEEYEMSLHPAGVLVRHGEVLILVPYANIYCAQLEAK